MNSDEKIQQVGKNIAEKASVIWNVADVLRGPFKPHEYGLVILPMTVIKRFHDCLLPTHEKVLAEAERVKKLEIKDTFLEKASGYKFYNTSKFTFEKLLADQYNIESNFKDYIYGFSSNVQDVLSKFDFENIIHRMVESNTLYLVIKEFASDKGYLGADKISAVDCGYIFEDLVRRFSESFDEEAGAHFTSRDIIYMMTDLLLTGEEISDNQSISVYDMAMGTSQMLSCMEERVKQLNPNAEILCFGQEINPSTYAIAKADMLIRGGNSDNMRYGDTLSEDKFDGFHFKYCISNPPFGIDWKREQSAVEKEHKLGESGRFSAGLPPVSDGQQLFLLNGLSKLEENGKMAIIQNGSPLFSGDAGSGSSEIRRYLLEHDFVDSIIQLSTDQFMNTGISTYIWILRKNKPKNRVQKVQLLDASHCFEPRRKSIGNKRNDITDYCRNLIVKAYSEFKNDAIYGDANGIYCKSKIFFNTDFGYSKITVERPLRLIFKDVSEKIDKILSDNTVNKKDAEILSEIKKLPNIDTERNDTDFFKYIATTKKDKKYPISVVTKLRTFLGTVSTDAKECLANPYDEKSTFAPNPDLRDTENVPYSEGIEEYFQREVLPYVKDAWIDAEKTKTGYEIPMTRYFYEYEQPEKSSEILKEIQILENEINESLKKIF